MGGRALRAQGSSAQKRLKEYVERNTATDNRVKRHLLGGVRSQTKLPSETSTMGVTGEIERLIGRQLQM